MYEILLYEEGLRMTMDEKIKTSDELEFAVFCIENVAAKLGVDAERVYQAFTEQSDILNGYMCRNMKCCIPRAGSISLMISLM